MLQADLGEDVFLRIVDVQLGRSYMQVQLWESSQLGELWGADPEEGVGFELGEVNS
jgi:hypothetical protein